jgi:hypothetical protein
LQHLNTTLVQPYRQAVQTLQTAALPNICGTLAASAAKVLDRAAAPLQVVWQKLASNLQDALDAVINTPVSSPDTLAQALFAELDEAVMTFQTALGPLLSDLSAASGVITALTNAPATLSTQLTNLKAQITDTNRVGCQNYVAHYGKDFDAVLANAGQSLDSPVICSESVWPHRRRLMSSSSAPICRR